MNKINYIKYCIALVFSLFISSASIITTGFYTSLHGFVYNPVIMISLYFVIFYFILKLEFKFLEKRFAKINVNGILVSLLVFLSIMILTSAYIKIDYYNGVGDFNDEFEQSNYFTELFDNVFHLSLIVIGIVSTIVTFVVTKNPKKKWKDILIINVTLFGINYGLFYGVAMVFGVIIFIFQLSYG